jgi:hypothetical protein
MMLIPQRMLYMTFSSLLLNLERLYDLGEVLSGTWLLVWPIGHEIEYELANIKL